MSEWKTYRLGDIIQLKSGGTPDKSNPDYWGGSIPWISAKSMYDDFISTSDLFITEEGLQAGSKIAKKDSILLLTRGSGLFNRIPVCYVVSDVAYNQDVKNIVLKQEDVTSIKFLYYWLYGNKELLSSMLETTGIGAGKIDTKRFLNLSISLPSQKEQARYIHLMDLLFDKIELNRRINANLEAQAQALFRSWFVDFEPFRDGPFVDSELGKIPQGWKVGTINEIIQILSGYAFKSDTFTEAGPYRLITIKNVQDGSLNIDGAAYLSDIPDKMPQHCHLAIGDILLSLTGNVGRVCIVDRDGLLLNQRVAKLQPKDKQNTFFTYALFRQDSFKQYLIQIAKGTAQLNLSPVETSDTKIVLPNQDVLLQFGEIGQPLFDNIVSNCKEIITLSALRDTLLPKLMAGEINLD